MIHHTTSINVLYLFLKYITADFYYDVKNCLFLHFNASLTAIFSACSFVNKAWLWLCEKISNVEINFELFESLKGFTEIYVLLFYTVST